jgi:DNA-binding NarL/FixJ family response regulator
MEDIRKKLSVLLIDSSFFIRERIRMRLIKFRNIGTVYEATDNASAKQLVNLHQPDVIILETQNTSNDCSDIIKSIKKASIKAIAIVLTNFPSSTMKKHCLELGADYVLDKSSEFEKIGEILEKIDHADMIPLQQH